MSVDAELFGKMLDGGGVKASGSKAALDENLREKGGSGAFSVCSGDVNEAELFLRISQ